MNAILRKLERWRHLLSGASCPALWRQWRLPLGVSLSLSLLILAIVLSVAYLGGAEAEAHPLAQPFIININRGEGDCTICQSDSNYDPEMGYFNLNCSGCPISDTTYVWSRSSFLTDTHSLGSPAYNSFLFWLYRDKGCGDFQIWGMSGNDTLTNLAPFSIPCTDRWGDYTLTSTFTPGPRSIFCGAGNCPFPTLFLEDRDILTVTAQNRTATWMLVELVEEPAGSPDGQHWTPLVPMPKIIPPGGSTAFPGTLQPNWPKGSQQEGVAAASSATPITATLVYSFGPTARISQTLVLARPQRVYVPLATRDWGAEW